MKACGRLVSWWDGEYEGNCVMPEDHTPTNLHYDGMVYFDEDHEEVPEESIPVDVRREWSRILSGWSG